MLPGYAGIIVRDGYYGYGHLTAALHAWCGVQYAESGIMRNGAAWVCGLLGGAGLARMPGAGSSA